MNDQMSFFKVCLIIFCSITTLSATENNLDSLYQEAKLAYSTDIDKALGLIQQVIDGARQKKDSVLLWQGLDRKGTILQATGDFEAVAANFQAALTISHLIEDNCGIGQVQISLSYFCLHQGAFGDGLMYADSAIAIFDKVCPNKTLSGKALNSKGSILVELENYQEATRSYQLAKTLTTDPIDLTVINENLAIVYYYENKFLQAQEIYLTNYELYQRSKDINSLAQVSNSLGALFYEMKDIEQAKNYFKRSVSFSKQVNNDLLLVDALINLGYLEMEFGNITDADNYRIKVNDIIEQSGGLEERLQLAEQSVEVYDYLEMYEDKSNAQEKVLLYSDSLNLVANQELLAEKLAELNIAEEKAKILTQKLYTASLAAILFLLSLVFYFLNNQSKEEKRTLLAKIKEEEALTRKKILDTSFQIKQEIHRKLHDRVSNPLSTASIYIDTFSDDNSRVEDLSTASKIVEETYDISRSIAYELLPYKIDWVDRINLILGGIERTKGIHAKINFNKKNINKHTFSQEKGEKVAAIIGNLLVNVEKHAAANQVLVHIEKKEKDIQIIIEDDGVGFDTNQQTGIGLISITSNIKDLNGQLTLTSVKGQGTKAEVLIPIV